MRDEDVTTTEGSGNVFRDLGLPFAGLYLGEAERARAEDPAFTGRGLGDRVLRRVEAELRALLAAWEARMTAENAAMAAGEAVGETLDIGHAMDDLEALLDR
jgi:hypothetical protein